MFQSGFDSSALKKTFVPLDAYIDEEAPSETMATEPTVLKALVGASVTTEDSDFDSNYRALLKATFEKYHVRQEKSVYKSAHLLKQTSEKADQIFTCLLNELEEHITHIDLYFATYPRAYVSILGRAQGQRLTPLDYIDKYQNGFVHACAWWHWRTNSETENPYDYHVDYFQSKGTPAWREMDEKKVNLKVYYSGSECDCLISFADLILKTVEVYHFGTIDYRSIRAPIVKRCNHYSLSRKIKSYDLSKYDWVIRATVPDDPLDISLTDYVKHPIYFIVWSPLLPRSTVKPSFEYSKFYNAIMHRAIETHGCVKFLDFTRDMHFWSNEDFIVPWETSDEEYVKQLVSMGFDNMPKTVKTPSIIT